MKTIKFLLLWLTLMAVIFSFSSCGENTNAKNGDFLASESDLSDDEKIEFQNCSDLAKAFIEQSLLEEGCSWTEKTKRRPSMFLFTPDGEDCGMHFEVMTEGEPAGYIRVLFFDEGEPFVEGYSYEPVDFGYCPSPTIYIGNDEYVRKNEDEDFYRSTKTAATYTKEELDLKFEELKDKYTK